MLYPQRGRGWNVKLIGIKCVFIVTPICSRTRDWLACVAPAKNNKRMRDAGRCASVTPLRSIRMRKRTYDFSAHFRVERGARTVLY
jgi:hypothetical protein